MKKIDLFTNDVNFLNIIKKKYKILNLFTEKKNLLKIKNQKYFKVFWVKNFLKIKKYITSSDFALCYSFGLIIKEELIKSYSEGIWNIHPGDLPKYRGRHPITAAFLNNEKKIGVCVHSINRNIDMGVLLSKTYIKREYFDDEQTILKKVLKKIPSLLNAASINKKNKKGKILTKGSYHKPFYRGIRIDDSKKFEHIFIHNAAKSQKIHGGIFVNNKKYYDSYFYNYKNLKKKKSEIILCKNNKKLILIK